MNDGEALKSASYWANRRTAIETLRNEILVPYFDVVAVLRVTNSRAIDMTEVDKTALKLTE